MIVRFRFRKMSFARLVDGRAMLDQGRGSSSRLQCTAMARSRSYRMQTSDDRSAALSGSHPIPEGVGSSNQPRHEHGGHWECSRGAKDAADCEVSLSFVGERTYSLGHQSTFPESTTACSCTMDHPQADITHRQDHVNANVWPHAMEYDNSHST